MKMSKLASFFIVISLGMWHSVAGSAEQNKLTVEPKRLPYGYIQAAPLKLVNDEEAANVRVRFVLGAAFDGKVGDANGWSDVFTAPGLDKTWNIGVQNQICVAILLSQNAAAVFMFNVLQLGNHEINFWGTAFDPKFNHSEGIEFRYKFTTGDLGPCVVTS